MKAINIREAVDFLKKRDNFTILTHKSPDGDALGSAFALCDFLKNQGKKVRVLNSDGFPSRFDFLYEGYEEEEFEEETVLAVDLATLGLLGDKLSKYNEDRKVDLCIDHHISNTGYAKYTLCDPEASAACILIYEIIKESGIALSYQAARCLYTGIATDTGCFKFENTTPKTHKIAGELMEYGIDFSTINRKMFEIKSKGRLLAEQNFIKNIEFRFCDRCALSVISLDDMEKYGVEKAELDGFAGIPLQIEGVELGITVKEVSENVYKASVRTVETVDASEFCKSFGGGGHKRAAGCQLDGSLEEVKEKLFEKAKEYLKG